MKKAQVLAIIPARGGSKGIPRKNLQVVNGLPLLEHSIRHAQASAEITRVVVSTDDAEIGDLARKCGAEVVQRPAEISGDQASSESALAHVLTDLGEREGYLPELVVFLQATSPIRMPGDLDNAIRKLRAEGADSLFSASRLNWFAWRLEGDTANPLNYDHRARPMRQTAPVDVIETGSFYIFKPNVLLESRSRLGGKVTTYMTSFIEAMQIDEPEDLRLLERVWPQPAVAGEISVRLLVLDFDGVLTDNYVWVDQHGNEMVRCTRADSLGISRLRSAGIEVVVLSTETNPVVEKRCAKLGIKCYQGHSNKAAILSQLLLARGLKPAEVAYVGNDVNDLECLRQVGLPVAVADAVADVKAAAKVVTKARGGEAAVREVCDLILERRAAEQSWQLSTAAAK